MPSTVIASFTYDAHSGELTIHFVSGAVYVYSGVPEEIYAALRASGTKGIYYNQHIRNKFTYRRSHEF